MVKITCKIEFSKFKSRARFMQLVGWIAPTMCFRARWCSPPLRPPLLARGALPILLPSAASLFNREFFNPFPGKQGSLGDNPWPPAPRFHPNPVPHYPLIREPLSWSWPVKGPHKKNGVGHAKCHATTTAPPRALAVSCVSNVVQMVPYQAERQINEKLRGALRNPLAMARPAQG